MYLQVLLSLGIVVVVVIDLNPAAAATERQQAIRCRERVGELHIEIVWSESELPHNNWGIRISLGNLVFRAPGKNGKDSG